ncbi:protein LEO1 [Cinnamomum micranthum f. kanehirae]|uniref:Protein LEO1 n=1 Tax=Cinnamomum micranthum f. kanehirae TaxID=337451 RepID=A0A3S3MIT1_9MAGN|nr:protein LEO1 [Cinnamomum micranthum f. kanehirae]
MGGEKRHQMMQNLFGEQSEDEEEEEVDSEHEVARPSHYLSDEGEGEGEAEIEGEGEAEIDIEGQGEAEVGSEAELHDVDPDRAESEGERAQSSPEREISDQRLESEGKEADSEEHDYRQRVMTSRREVIASGSERSDENNYVDDGDEEVNQARISGRQVLLASGSERSEENNYVDDGDEEVNQARRSRSPQEQKDDAHISQSVAGIRDVFGDSDEDEPADYAPRNDFDQDSHRTPIEEESYEKDLQPEDIVPDEEPQYESEEENFEQKPKEKPVGPPLEMEIPLHPPPAQPEKMNIIKVSNIMGFESKPFDPKTFVEEDVFVTDESGAKKRIRLEDNIVRWRRVRTRDGTMSCESNARFVRWSDGSLQLLIGNEVLDISVQEAHHDQTHLFLRHGKGILQSQGRLLRKMRFMPSSLSSKSHRLLTAIVDSRHKKVYKVKNCITDIDPEREKEEKEKAEGQTIRANVLLQRKREKVNKKYTQTVDRGRQLSPGFLEEALEEDDEPEDYYESRHSAAARRRFEDDLEVEAQAERRIINAKKHSHVSRDVARKSSLPASRMSRRPVENLSESEREESEYESDGDEGEQSPVRQRMEEPEHEDEDDEEEEEAEEAEANDASEEDDVEEPPRRNKDSGASLKRKEIDSDADSPPRKPPAHRRMAVVFDSDEE